MIMDDNKIMEAAKLIANSSAALIEAMGMMSENIERAIGASLWRIPRRPLIKWL